MTIPSGVPSSMSWPRAVSLALVMSVALTLLLMLIPHWILTALPFGSRSVRVVLATGWIGLSTIGVMVLGRRWLAPPPREGQALS